MPAFQFLIRSVRSITKFSAVLTVNVVSDSRLDKTSFAIFFCQNLYHNLGQKLKKFYKVCEMLTMSKTSIYESDKLFEDGSEDFEDDEPPRHPHPINNRWKST